MLWLLCEIYKENTLSEQLSDNRFVFDIDEYKGYSGM